MIRRVLMTADTVGGVWTFAMELAEALGSHGVRVVLAALGGPPSAAQRVEACRIPNLDLLASDFKLEWMLDPWRDVEESGRWLLDLEEQYAPDVVHLNSFGHGALKWSAPVVVTAHSCVLSWWSAVKGGEAPAEWARYRGLVKRTLRAADAITAPSRAMAGELARLYGARTCRVVPNGRRASRFRAADKEAMILTAGRLWDEAKNAAAVARAARSLPWPVYVAGEHRHPDGGAAAFSGCTLLGRLGAAEIAGWFARAAIYALPARYEPFGLSALEAALSECALVLGDIPSLRETWSGAAEFVAPDDSGALEAALRGLIERPRRREELAEAAARRARSLTPARMAHEYLDVYQTAGRRTLCAS
jgi:glycosyltransferase involved in cell wall biosynthesis